MMHALANSWALFAAMHAGFTKNDQPVQWSAEFSLAQGTPLFPHILLRNCKVGPLSDHPEFLV